MNCNVELYIYKTDGISICPKCSKQEKIIVESQINHHIRIHQKKLHIFLI